MTAPPTASPTTSPDEVERLLAEIAARDAERARLMPTEKDALNMMFSAYGRLKQLGWRDIMYAPRDGTRVETISAGSTGIHWGHRDPQGCWWIEDGHDLWPGDPVLYRIPKEELERMSAKMRAAVLAVYGEPNV